MDAQLAESEIQKLHRSDTKKNLIWMRHYVYDKYLSLHKLPPKPRVQLYNKKYSKLLYQSIRKKAACKRRCIVLTS